MDSTAILAGFAVGAIVGMTGVGGGSLMTPRLIGAFRLSPAVAIGTDLWFAALAKTGGALLLGSLPGIWLGEQLTKQLPERLVRGLLCVSLVTAGIQVI